MNPLRLQAVENIYIYSYYKDPPYLLANRNGLLNDFTNSLNRLAAGKFHFLFVPANKLRIDLILKNQEEAIIPFVNPFWVGDSNMSKFHWSKPLLHDQNILISNKSKKIEVEKLSLLKKASLAGIYGHRYKVLGEFISKENLIRKDYSQFLQCLKLVSNKKMDMTVIPESIYKQLIQQVELRDELYQARDPLFVFDRRILMTKSLTNHYKDVMGLIHQLSNDQMWKKTILKYRLKMP